MFGIGTWELIVIAVLALVILGPNKLPEMARLVGRNLAKVRQAADEVKREIKLDEIRHELENPTLELPQMDTRRKQNNPYPKTAEEPVSMPSPVAAERPEEPLPQEPAKKE